MANEEQIEELKRLIAEEKEEKRAYKNSPMARAAEAERRERILAAKTTRPKPDMCEVCNKGGRIVFDHKHTDKKERWHEMNSGPFRGWLCTRCNLILGHAKDDIVLLEKLIIYLKASDNADSE